MTEHRIRNAALLAALVLAAGSGYGRDDRLASHEPATVGEARAGRNAAGLPVRAPADRVAVGIYEFRSSVNEVPARAGTDLFTTALVQSGQFRVVERARSVEGALRERQLAAAGVADAGAGALPLRAAKYVFEGTISEATASQTQRSAGVTIAGMEVGRAGNRDVLSIDVRVVEVATGDIVDAVTVSKPVASETASVAGVGNLIGTVLWQRGRPATYAPDIQLQQQRKESVDQALREAIELAVATLAARLAP